MSRNIQNKSTLWLKSGAVAAVFALSAAPVSAAEINFEFAGEESAGTLWFSAGGNVLDNHSFGAGTPLDVAASNGADYSAATLAAQWDFTITDANSSEWPPITGTEDSVRVSTTWDGFIGESGGGHDFQTLFSHIFGDGQEAYNSALGGWVPINNGSSINGHTMDPVWTSIFIEDLTMLREGSAGTFAILADTEGQLNLESHLSGTGGQTSITVIGSGSLQAVPEPGALTLLMLSLSGLVAFRRRNARR